jgi:fused signal recognition particle receptor
MFEGLKARLRQVQAQLGTSIRTGDELPEEAPAPSDNVPATGGTGFMDRAKALIRDRELIISEREITEPLANLEMVLLENDVAVPVAEEITSHLRADLVGTRRKIGESIDGVILQALKGALGSVLGEGFDLKGYIRGHERPVRILFVGVNGTGKTTTIAKIGSYLQKAGFSVVIAAGDTFRAGAIEQIDVHAERVGIRVIRHQHGADPSAVLFDAVQYALAHKIDVVLADTAGRFHNKANLMSQLSKMKRVMSPDLVVYVDEAVAGNDAVIRASEFERTVGADAVVLTKVDMDSRGGAAISIAHTIGKPLMFLGTGQGYDDITPFVPEAVIADLLGEAA